MGEPVDFSEWMRFEAAKSDRRYREAWAEHKREMDHMWAEHRREMDRIIGRNDDVILRNLEELRAAERKRNEVVDVLHDQSDERRALIEAQIRLREMLERWREEDGPA